MSTLLQINTNLLPGNGASTLANRFVAGWRRAHPDGKLIVRDLAAEPVPHLDRARFAAFVARPEERTPEQAAAVAYSDRLIEQLKGAEVVVVVLPMHHAGVPSTLVAYFENIARAGVTYGYTEKGLAGLLTDKIVYVFAARGGPWARVPRDPQRTYIRDVLGFLGMTHVEFIYAEPDADIARIAA